MKPEVALKILRSVAFGRLEHAAWFVLGDFLVAFGASLLAITLAQALGILR